MSHQSTEQNVTPAFTALFFPLKQPNRAHFTTCAPAACGEVRKPRIHVILVHVRFYGPRGCSSMVERTLPKPDTRVRFPSAAPLRSPAQRLETSFLGFRESLTLKNRPIRDDFLPPARQPLSKSFGICQSFFIFPTRLIPRAGGFWQRVKAIKTPPRTTIKVLC